MRCYSRWFSTIPVGDLRAHPLLKPSLYGLRSSPGPLASGATIAHIELRQSEDPHVAAHVGATGSCTYYDAGSV